MVSLNSGAVTKINTVSLYSGAVLTALSASLPQQLDHLKSLTAWQPDRSQLDSSQLNSLIAWQLSAWQLDSFMAMTDVSSHAIKLSRKLSCQAVEVVKLLRRSSCWGSEAVKLSSWELSSYQAVKLRAVRLSSCQAVKLASCQADICQALKLSSSEALQVVNKYCPWM